MKTLPSSSLCAPYFLISTLLFLPWTLMGMEASQPTPELAASQNSGRSSTLEPKQPIARASSTKKIKDTWQKLWGKEEIQKSEVFSDTKSTGEPAEIQDYERAMKDIQEYSVKHLIKRAIEKHDEQIQERMEKYEHDLLEKFKKRLEAQNLNLAKYLATMIEDQQKIVSQLQVKVEKLEETTPHFLQSQEQRLSRIEEMLSECRALSAKTRQRTELLLQQREQRDNSLDGEMHNLFSELDEFIMKGEQNEKSKQPTSLEHATNDVHEQYTAYL